MIIITVEINIKPGSRQEAILASQKMAQASQAEAGCAAYRFYVDIEDPNKFFLFELWETEEALAAHQETVHMAELTQQLPKLLSSEISVKRYQAESM